MQPVVTEHSEWRHLFLTTHTIPNRMNPVTVPARLVPYPCPKELIWSMTKACRTGVESGGSPDVSLLTCWTSFLQVPVAVVSEAVVSEAS